MASLTWWMWVWVNSRSWWWTGRPGMLRFMGSQRVGHDWATELNWTENQYSVKLGVWSGEGDGNPLQYSCLENPMDGGAWRAAVHGVARNRIQLSDFTFTFHFHALEKEMATHSLQCSCLENPSDGGAWWAAIYGVAQSRTRLKRPSSSSSRSIKYFGNGSRARNIGNLQWQLPEFLCITLHQLANKNIGTASHLNSIKKEEPNSNWIGRKESKQLFAAYTLIAFILFCFHSFLTWLLLTNK